MNTRSSAQDMSCQICYLNYPNSVSTRWPRCYMNSNSPNFLPETSHFPAKHLWECWGLGCGVVKFRKKKRCVCAVGGGLQVCFFLEDQQRGAVNPSWFWSDKYLVVSAACWADPFQILHQGALPPRGQKIKTCFPAWWGTKLSLAHRAEAREESGERGVQDCSNEQLERAEAHFLEKKGAVHTLLLPRCQTLDSGQGVPG